MDSTTPMQRPAEPTTEIRDAAALLARAEDMRKAKHWAEAAAAYQQAVADQETPPGEICLKIARCFHALGNNESAFRWCLRVVDAGDAFLPWQAAAALLEKILAAYTPTTKRTARIALLGSYTTAQLVPMLRLAAMRESIALDIYEAPFGQYRQEILNPASRLYATDPEFVVFAVHEGELALPQFSKTPDDAVAAELARWTSLWAALAGRSRARVIQYTFAISEKTPMGHLGARLSGSRYAMTQRLNIELARAAGSQVSIVDCDRLSALFGKTRWFDDKYWHMAKQAVALDALPLLARHTVAVLAADLGLSRKCLVLDLDNTLWGGVIGEDGMQGIRLGNAVGNGSNPAEGEAHAALQDYILRLKEKGVILAVCSKNNEADAREPFEKHPDMRIRLDDIAMFVANWDDKPSNLRRIAQTLNIGIDSLVFLDDNPVEREIVRQMLPEVAVIPLPRDPARYARALSEFLLFETGSFTSEDAERTSQYKAMAEIAQLEASATSIEDFYRSLQMRAVIAPFDETSLPRIVQLIGKTNQFNLTTRRHTLPAVQGFISDSDCFHVSLRLRDRFTDHGLVSLMIAFKRDDVMDIDTWLMSCRVIGRTVEAELLSRLSIAARQFGCTKLRGTFIPTAKNELCKDVFKQFNFDLEREENGTTTWIYDLAAKGPITNAFIEAEQPGVQS